LFDSLFVKVRRRFRFFVFRIREKLLIVRHLVGVGRSGPAFGVLLPKLLAFPGFPSKV
jgi:hypothetical protein